MRVAEVTQFGGPDVLKLAEQPEPTPGPGQLVVEVVAAEVLFLDTQLRSGWGRAFFSLEPPFVPGSGVAGAVSRVGSGVDADWVGRRVVAGTGPSGTYVGGGYAERAVVSASDAFEVPEVLELPAALAGLHDGLTALSRLEKAAIRPGDRVLVTAAGGSLGSWLVPLARSAGATVIAAARGERKLAHIRELGADVAVDYSEDDWSKQVLAATGEAGVDVVFDGAGGRIGRDALGVTGSGGRFFSYGAASGDFAAIDAAEVERRQITVVGIGDRIESEDEVRLIKQALAELAAGRVAPAIGQRVPLDRAADAHAAIEAREVIGKTVLQP